MFEKSGEKIKKVSRTIFVLNVVIVFAVGVFWIVLSKGLFLMIVLIAAVLIIVCSWVSLLVLYAFGDLVDSSVQMAELLQEKRINPLTEIFKLYEAGVLTKEEFDAQKNLLINRDLNSIAELIDIKEGYEKGLISEKEYLEIKKDVLAELNLQNEIKTYKVILDYGESFKITAPNNVTKKEVGKIVRKMGHNDAIKTYTRL